MSNRSNCLFHVTVSRALFGLTALAILVCAAGVAAPPNSQDAPDRLAESSAANDALIEAVFEAECAKDAPEAKPAGSAGQTPNANRGGFETIPVDFHAVSWPP